MGKLVLTSQPGLFLSSFCCFKTNREEFENNPCPRPSICPIGHLSHTPWVTLSSTLTLTEVSLHCWQTCCSLSLICLWKAARMHGYSVQISENSPYHYENHFDCTGNQQSPWSYFRPIVLFSIFFPHSGIHFQMSLTAPGSQVIFFSSLCFSTSGFSCFLVWTCLAFIINFLNYMSAAGSWIVSWWQGSGTSTDWNRWLPLL